MQAVDIEASQYRRGREQVRSFPFAMGWSARPASNSKFAKRISSAPDRLTFSSEKISSRK
jgi:hypothetical protein